MTGRRSLLGLAVLTLLALGLYLGLRSPTSELPVVAIHFDDAGANDLFAPPKQGDKKRWLKARYQDIDGQSRRGKAALRGFSAWHHGRAKPSLRIKAKGKHRSGPEFVELSRPEDPLAICNWLPDQLGAALGLMHEHSEPVRLLLNGRDCGVYLRSVRPGDDLCAAERRVRGTFFKGDSLGARRHLDLWAGSDAWRAVGEQNPAANATLDVLLAAVREPPTIGSREQLAATLDLETAARANAVAVLTGSIHADQVHNHVLFYDPAKHRIEPLLWDANGFGIHAEAQLPVEVARHPLAQRLLCDPEYLHRRNQVLWELLHGSGSPKALQTIVAQRLARLDSALQSDPAIVRLALRHGRFEPVVVGYEGLGEAQEQFAQFVEQRAAHLEHWFCQAQVAWQPAPDNPEHTVVTVFGTVAVKLSQHGGQPTRSPAGRDASILWPGIGTKLQQGTQLRDAQGRGVSAPFGEPAALEYTIACRCQDLTAHNAITGKQLKPAPWPTGLQQSRSVHPWQTPAQPVAPIVLGPGKVRIDTAMHIRHPAGLTILPNTTLDLAASIRCDGHFEAIATEDQGIRINTNGHGIQLVGSRVRMQHVHWVGHSDAASPRERKGAMLQLGACQSEIVNCEFERAPGTAVRILNGIANVENTTFGAGNLIALTVEAANLRMSNVDCLSSHRAIVARNGARVHWQQGTMSGHMVGVTAKRSNASFAGAEVELDHVTCHSAGHFDVDCNAACVVRLIATEAHSNPVAAGEVTTEGSAAQLAAPR